MSAHRPLNPLLLIDQSHAMDRHCADHQVSHEQATPLRLLQLTDLHLFADPTEQLLGITTQLGFETVLAQALRRTPAASGLILTGDLVQDDSASGYAYLAERLAATGLPFFSVPGNHDRHDLMRQCLGDVTPGKMALRRLDTWNLVFLDSSDPGVDSGRLGKEQIRRLADLLAAEETPTLIFLHHHPTPIGSTWMDTLGVVDGQELLALCDRHPQVRGIVFGHIHQEFTAQRGGYQLLGAPSTCVQFLPGSVDFAVDPRPPGWRELLLHPDGRLTSQIMRLDSYQEMPLQHASGY
mgnify:CR=1 FL=1